VLELNPDALAEADKADQERKAKAPHSLSPLHGIPILVKDNIATKDKMNTTAGSFALLGSVVPRDAGVVTRLRKAGAIIIGKATLSEWSHYRSDAAPSGWSARGGHGKVVHFLLLYYLLSLFYTFVEVREEIQIMHVSLPNNLIFWRLCTIPFEMFFHLLSGC